MTILSNCNIPGLTIIKDPTLSQVVDVGAAAIPPNVFLTLVQITTWLHMSGIHAEQVSSMQMSPEAKFSLFSVIYGVQGRARTSLHWDLDEPDVFQIVRLETGVPPSEKVTKYPINDWHPIARDLLALVSHPDMY